MLNSNVNCIPSVWCDCPTHIASVRRQGKPIDDPFRKGLGNAFQWYDMLSQTLDDRVDAMVEDAEQKLESAPSANLRSGPAPSATPAPASSPGEAATPELQKGKAAKVLRDRCPACFGLEEWGRSFNM